MTYCKYFYDDYSNKSNFQVKISCDGTCEKFRIQRYSKFWDLDINLFTDLQAYFGILHSTHWQSETIYGYSYAFVKNQINRFKLLSFQKAIFIGGGSVVNQLYMYRSTVLIIGGLSWKGINPIDFSSESKFYISIHYGNSAWFMRTALAVLLFLLLN